MRVAFYAPLKSPNHPVASGDRSIASDLWASFRGRGHDCLLLSEFRTRFFYQSAAGVAAAAGQLVAAAARAARFRPDLFFSYHVYYKAPDPIGPALAALFRKPYVIYEASHSERPRKRLATLPGYHLARWAVRRAEHVFSDMTDDIECLRLVLPDARISYVPPSVDADRFRPEPEARRLWRRANGIPSEEPLIACAAMLRANRKAEGVRFLIDRLGELAREGLRFRFALAGGGPCMEDIRARAAAALGPRALLLGAVLRDEVGALLRAADLFAFPGLDEGFGLVFLEAQACGLPVVAFRDGGIPDAVAEGETGFLTPVLDAEAYSDALRRLLRDAELRRRMGGAARARMLQRHHPRLNYGAVVERCEALTSPRPAPSEAFAAAAGDRGEVTAGRL